MKGSDFLTKFGPTIDQATTVDPRHEYAVQSATDHHVHEAQRVRNFIHFLEQAPGMTRTQPSAVSPSTRRPHHVRLTRRLHPRRACSARNEADLLVDLVRKHERAGLYGAKITGGGCGGTVAISPTTPPPPMPRSSRSPTPTNSKPAKSPRFSGAPAPAPGSGHPTALPARVATVASNLVFQSSSGQSHAGPANPAVRTEAKQCASSHS